MKDRLIGARYAETLVKLAKEKNELDRVASDLDLVAQALFEEKDMMRFLEGPQFSDDEKKTLVKRVFEKKVQDTTLDFMLLLLDKYRIAWIFFIIEQFQIMKKAEEKVADADVVSSFSLSDDLKGELSRALARITNKKVRLSLKVDPAIIGGLIVSIGNRRIDASIKGRLHELKDEMLAARVN